MSTFVLKPGARMRAARGMFTADELAGVERFYQATPATPLHRRGNVWIKDESRRLGLNAFKILGVRYAVERMELAQDTVFACATDGNHGRAVARTAARKGYAAHIYLPAHASRQRVESIRGEGAEVHIAEGNYDEAVRMAAREAERNGWLVVSDTSWPGYEQIPRDIMCGYTQIAAEAARQWEAPPDVVFVQAGVGGLAVAIGSWFAARFGAYRPSLVLCQPAQSPCIVEAARRNAPVALSGSLETIMDCLSAGEVSHTAWPVIAELYDAYVGIEERAAEQAVEWLGPQGVDAGYAGACGVAAWREVEHNPHFEPVKEFLELGPESQVLTIVTEGMLR